MKSLLAAIALMECLDLALARQLKGSDVAMAAGRSMADAMMEGKKVAGEPSNVITVGKIEGASARKLMKELTRELQCDGTASCSGTTECEDCDCCGTEDCECEDCAEGCEGGDCAAPACEDGDCAEPACEGGDCAPEPSCTVQMGACTGGPDKDCATYFTSMLYYNVMANGCMSQTILYPDGSTCPMAVEGCPVDEIVWMCTNCPWMMTQNTCNKPKFPPCLMAALPDCYELTGGFVPHNPRGLAKMLAYQERKAAKA